MNFEYDGKSRAAGVYTITNLLNERVYVGSCKEFKVRWHQHWRMLIAGKHYNKFLQRDFAKCGPDAFIFEVLEVVEGNKEQRVQAEQRYIDQWFDAKGKCYNLRSRAVSVEGCWSKTPKETRKKHSENFKRLWRNPDHREKMSVKTKKQFENPEYGSRLRGAAARASAKLFHLVDPMGVSIEIFNLKQFARDNNLTYSCLFRIATGKQKVYKGWTIQPT